MTTFTFGNADGLNVPVTTSGDTYILGNAAGDSVLAAASGARCCRHEERAVRAVL